MHGEYKVPGGKLVMVDFQLRNNQLHQVRLAGDFFLEPEDILERINQSLEGVSAQLGLEAYIHRVKSVLPENAILVGVSAEAIGRVIQRALAQPSRWTDHQFSIIHQPAQSAALHMALDEILLEAVAKGKRKPLLRIWEWSETAVIIGNFQSLQNEVDIKAAQARDIRVMRRITGGGAMFVEPGNSITWSLIVPESLLQGLTLVDSYAFLDDWVLSALHKLGIQATYVPINDIVSSTGKIAGAAQKRSAGAILHHVTMAYDIDVDAMLTVLRIGHEKISDKGITSSGKRIDPLKSQTGMSRDAIIESMKQSFREHLKTQDDEITPKELTFAEQLAYEKFNNPNWLARIP